MADDRGWIPQKKKQNSYPIHPDCQ